MPMEPQIKRGDIFYADLSPVVGSEQGGVRPILIIQNDIGNRYSPTVIAGAITSRLTKAKLPTHIEIASGSFGLQRDSVILLDVQQFTVVVPVGEVVRIFVFAYPDALRALVFPYFVLRQHFISLRGA